jgi:hypothetical protein
LPHALNILETAERGRQEIREMSGQVPLAALPTIAPYFSPRSSGCFEKNSETNSWLFTPMLVEVATSGLEPTHISTPLRTGELGENDPDVLKAWRITLQPGIDFMWARQEENQSRGSQTPP